MTFLAISHLIEIILFVYQPIEIIPFDYPPRIVGVIPVSKRNLLIISSMASGTILGRTMLVLFGKVLKYLPFKY